MIFHPSEEQRAIQDAVRGALAAAMPFERLMAIADAADEIDRPSWEALMALGIGGLMLPEAAGGAGQGLVDLAMAGEMLGAGAAVGPFVEHAIAALALTLSEDDRVKQRWLPGLISGAAIGTLALSGTWLPETWSVEVADHALTGEAPLVVGAREAGLLLVGTRGGGLALAEAADVAIRSLPGSDRTRKISHVTFDGAPATMLFEAGDPAVARLFDAALVLVTADALGGAQHCLDQAVAYAKQREQFDRPIGAFQAVKHQLAGMALEVEPARALIWYAAHAWDVGAADARHAAALAKAHLADRYVSVARAAVAVHGGIGYTWDHGLHIWFRRALFDYAYLGSPSVHRERAIGLAGW